MKREKLTSINWMAKYLKIIDMDARLVPLFLNATQQKVHNTLNLQKRENLPVRALICKARREGVSTFIEADFFEEINLKPNRYACVTSADSDGTDKIFKMTKLFQDEMPAGVKRPTVFSNRKEIVYDRPHRSQFLAQTAGKEVFGRGGLTHYLHVSEAAFIKDAKTKFGGARQEVPDKPNTSIILESTANGMAGLFYEMFWEAVTDWKKTRNLANFIPIFLPWFIFPDYQESIPPTVQFVAGRPHDEDCRSEWCEAEQELIRKYQLSVEQLFWRRRAIKMRCQSDLTLFLQEYPATAREAFQQSGRSYFNQELVDEYEKVADAVAAEQRLPKRVLFDTRAKPYGVNWSKNCWRIWQFPVPDHSYAIGADTQEGKPSDPDDPKSNYDNHAVKVLDRTTGEYVAEWLGQGDQHDLGVQVLYAAKAYCNAWVAPELPYGMIVLDVLKQNGYEHIYLRQTQDEHYDPADSDNLGWKTTPITRPKMLQDFRHAFNEKHIRIYSKDLLAEMRTFAIDKNGKVCHLPGEHDDLIFAAMIAWQIHLRMPTRPRPYEADDMFEPEKDRKPSIIRTGAVDDWEPGEDEEPEGLSYID